MSVEKPDPVKVLFILCLSEVRNKLKQKLRPGDIKYLVIWFYHDQFTERFNSRVLLLMSCTQI